MTAPAPKSHALVTLEAELIRQRRMWRGAMAAMADAAWRATSAQSHAQAAQRMIFDTEAALVALGATPPLDQPSDEERRVIAADGPAAQPWHAAPTSITPELSDA